MSNAEQCKDCKSFNPTRETTFGTCFPVARFLAGHPVTTPAGVHASFGCVLWEEKKCEEVYVLPLIKLNYACNICNHEVICNKIDEIIDHLNNRS